MHSRVSRLRGHACPTHGAPVVRSALTNGSAAGGSGSDFCNPLDASFLAPTDGSENSNLTVVPATLWTDFAGSNDVCVFIGSVHNDPERLALR